MKKKGIIVILGLIVIIVAILGGLYYFGKQPVSKKSEPVTFEIGKGDSKFTVVDNLKSSNLINSKISAYIYIVLHGKTNLQAGKYNFNRNMTLNEVIDCLDAGKTNVNAKTIKLTFVEGKKIPEYADLIAVEFGYNAKEVMEVFQNKDFLNKMIEKYWFIDEDILKEGIYYPLEGYVFPDTYEFYSDESVENIIIRMLDTMEEKLSPYKDKIKNSGFKASEILNMAAIIEKEAAEKEDKLKISQVIRKRLDMNMSLGMDVTTYYAVKKDFTEPLNSVDLSSNNPYNTRNVNLIGLPIGPICSPSIESIDAALNPSDTNYVYFYADLNTGKVYFAETNAEFLKIKQTIGG